MANDSAHLRLGSAFVFIKAQLSAFTGGLADYLIMILLTQGAGLFYVYSIWLSGMAGAVVNFSINRHWTFKHNSVSTLSSLPRFMVMVLMSILLKSAGTYLLTSAAGLDYKISRICTDALVSIGFNFTLQKYWVFKHRG